MQCSHSWCLGLHSTCAEVFRSLRVFAGTDGYRFRGDHELHSRGHRSYFFAMIFVAEEAVSGPDHVVRLAFREAGRATTTSAGLEPVGLKSGPPGERTWFIADDSTGCARPAVRRAFRRGARRPRRRA